MDFNFRWRWGLHWRFNRFSFNHWRLWCQIREKRHLIGEPKMDKKCKWFRGKVYIKKPKLQQIPYQCCSKDEKWRWKYHYCWRYERACKTLIKSQSKQDSSPKLSSDLLVSLCPNYSENQWASQPSIQVVKCSTVLNNTKKCSQMLRYAQKFKILHFSILAFAF